MYMFIIIVSILLIYSSSALDNLYSDSYNSTSQSSTSSNTNNARVIYDEDLFVNDQCSMDEDILSRSTRYIQGNPEILLSN